jgi:uncharacterized protein (DUF2235 family)
LKDIILEAYKWLSHTYKPGDKIFIFGDISCSVSPSAVIKDDTGFSRGAYQARALAAMIERVGEAFIYVSFW